MKEAQEKKIRKEEMILPAVKKNGGLDTREEATKINNTSIHMYIHAYIHGLIQIYC